MWIRVNKMFKSSTQLTDFIVGLESAHAKRMHIHSDTHETSDWNLLVETVCYKKLTFIIYTYTPTLW
jgi:hypothetical protein